MKIITATQKQIFLDARRAGNSIRKSAQRAGFSFGTGRRYDRLRQTGELHREILESKSPMEQQQILKLVSKTLEEIEKRGIENMTDKDLIALVSKAPALLKSMNQSTREEEDELDEIWRQVSQEMETSNEETQKEY